MAEPPHRIRMQLKTKEGPTDPKQLKRPSFQHQNSLSLTCPLLNTKYLGKRHDSLRLSLFGISIGRSCD